ncbi:hypothetical protein SISSUDRAFT_1107972 [Sistotremastrum suecicum HHB10207 ss-3]|uniref:MYND-type domain-containing protein n=1 Tax=Sistotremastrum suecicum HHB10207 ss-3 TaxID=1314776 RepID=A0A165WGM8_9AGAM|nr:hypothetical protein SISSUDRAFT_1107972 [Sistotremastrum suecicum HHB10207 ss-3]
MPDNKGVLLFVAFMQCSSLAIRCRGFIGLLNLHYADFAQDLRFCNPHVLDDEIAPEVGRIYANLEEAMRYRPPEIPDVSERYHNPSLEELFGTNPFHAYEIAMRFVRYELEGPQSDKDLMPYLQKYLDVHESAAGLFKDLDSALRFHKQEYETEVLLLARLMHMYPGLPKVDDPSDFHRYINMGVTANAAYCISRWPEKAYFHYAKVKSQTGTEYATVAAAAAKLPDCSPYLSAKIFYELVINLLGYGIVSMSMRPGLNRWEWPDTKSASLFFSPVQNQLIVASDRVGRESAEGQILAILSFISVLLSGGPDLGTDMLEGPIPSIRENLQNLNAMKCSEHQEARHAMADYVQYRRRAAIRWSTFILAVRRVEPAAAEGRRLRAREALQSGFLRTESREETYLALGENAEAKGAIRCAWCGRMSVALRKCSRCEKVKYCNASCQRSHWVDGHKTVCISPIIQV